MTRKHNFAELSIDDIRGQVRAELVKRLGEEADVWVREMFQTFAVYEFEGKQFKLPFTVDGADVTVGQPEEVVGEFVPVAEMADFNSQWVEIFKVGDYGEKGTYSQADLDAMAANLSSVKWKPGAIIGHDERDPKLGEVKGLKRAGDVLLAQFHKVHPLLETGVAEGRYPDRSVGLYTDPKGNGPMLRHVAFLGAVPPEVKDLAPIQFSKDDEHVVINFKEDSMTQKNNDAPQLSEEQVGIFTRFVEGLKEIFSADGGKSSGDSRLPRSFSDAELKERLEAATKPLSDEIAALKEGSKTASTSQRQAEVTAFVEKMKAGNRWVPAYDKARLPELLTAAATGQDSITFSEGEGDKKQEKTVSLFDGFRAFLEALPEIVPLGEHAGHAGAPAKVTTIKFNETRDLKVDPESLALNDRAEAIAAELRKQDSTLTELAAFKEGLSRARAELASGSRPGGIAAGKA